MGHKRHSMVVWHRQNWDLEEGSLVLVAYLFYSQEDEMLGEKERNDGVSGHDTALLS